MTPIPGSCCRRILLIAILSILGWRHSVAQTYCKPALGGCCEWISNVTLGTINNNTFNETGFADYTAISTVITKGTTYPISVQVSTNSTFVEHVKVYFDWDRDYIFESSLYLGSIKFKGHHVFSGNVTVPSNALDGCSMMRVFVQYSQQPESACASVGDGEVEDYTLVVSNTSVPVADFSIPTHACREVPISFSNSSAISDGSTLSYLWSFGDDTNSTSSNPSKTYAAAGTYHVKLTASTYCTSHTVTKSITVNAIPAISVQPVNTSLCDGENAVFSVGASSPGILYRWEVNQGSGFQDLIDTEVYNNVATSSLNITGATSDMNGYQYRCVASTMCSTTSSTATLTVNSPPIITTHPLTASTCPGGTISYKLVATGTGLAYQWQGNSGIGFVNLINGGPYSNVTTNTLSISEITSALTHNQYRCVVIGTCTSVSSSTQIIINEPPLLLAQPLNVKVMADSSASFVVLATGTHLTYQWQENSGSGFVNLANNLNYSNTATSSLNIKQTTLSQNGSLFRCIVSGACTPEVTSNFAILTVKNPMPTITSTALLTATEDLLYTYTLTTADETGNALIYSARVKPGWLSFNPNTGVLSGIPTNGEVGLHTVTLRVNNGILNADQTFVVQVINTNDAPIITSTAITSSVEGNIYTYKFSASDEDVNEVLEYEVLLKPIWLDFDVATGILSGHPSSAEVGKYQISLRVNDGKVLVDQNFEITVIAIETPEIIPPTASNPTDIFLSNTNFGTSLIEPIGTLTTTDQGSSQHQYQFATGVGDQHNNLFRIEANVLFLDKNTDPSYTNQFSIRVRSTNEFSNSIDAVFTLEKSEPESNLSGIRIPNTFSPNADGINDKWIIKDLHDFSDVSINVYDRSGVSIYNSTNPIQGWDGRTPGGRMLEGPFFYIVMIKDVVKKGVLILIK